MAERMPAWSLPHGRDCVPTIEHYLPLLVALGLCIDGQPVRALYTDWEYGSLALHSYAITGQEGRRHR